MSGRQVQAKIAFSRITSDEPKILTKTLSLHDGKIRKTAAAQMTRGSVEPVCVDGAAGFAAVLEGLAQNQALAYGLPLAGACALYSRKRYAGLPESRRKTASTRTKERFAFTAQPGVMMLDYDPPAGADPLTPEALHAAIAAVLPGLDTCAHVQWTSSSSHIYDSEGVQLAGVRGQRIYLMVADARDIPRAGGVLSDRLWLAGYGYYAVSKSGSRLERCLTDTAVWETNRLDFAAGAVCRHGLEQRRGAPVAHEGGLLDTAAALADLTDDDIEKVCQLKAEAYAAAVGEAATMREQWVEDRARDAIARRPDMDPEALHAALSEARARARHAVTGDTLDGDWRVHVEGHGEVPVSALLADRARYDQCRTMDPLEPDYGGGRAVGYLALRGGHPFLYSHAHGGRTYRLTQSLHRIEHVRGTTQTTTDQTLSYLRRADLLYDRGSELVYVHDGQLHAVNGAALSYVLARDVQYVQTVARGKGKDRALAQQLIDPPQGMLNQLVAIDRGLRPLKAAITAPVMAADGRLVQTYGYDRRSELYVAADCREVEVPETVSERAALAALDTLWHPFREFACAERIDRGVLLSAILTAIQRPILPTAPGFALDAPVQGTGKTYLAQCLMALSQGRLTAIDPPSDERGDAELRKRLLSGAMSAPAVTMWDNWMGTLRSGSLAAFLTSETFADRVLSESRRATVDTRTLFLLTGNNVSLAGDLPRRILRCRLDARREDLDNRQFSGNPRGDILARRLELVQAGLTLLRGYLQSGWQPVGTTGSYEEWDGTVRQCCAWVASLLPEQYQDPHDAIVTAKDEDPERQELDELLGALTEVMAGPGIATDTRGWFTARAVHAAAEGGDAASERLREVLEGLSHGALTARGVGMILTYRLDRLEGGRCLRGRVRRGESARYRLDLG